MVHNPAINFVIIAMIFVLHETMYYIQLFSFANTNNFLTMNISLKKFIEFRLDCKNIVSLDCKHLKHRLYHVDCRKI